MLSDKKVRSMSERHCDRIVDERGRETFEFDDHGLLAFARAIEEAARKEERERAVRAGVAAGRDDACDYCEHGFCSEGCTDNTPEACNDAAFRLAIERLEEDDAE